MSSVKSLPPDRLTVIDRSSLICRGGQRAKLEDDRDVTNRSPDSDAPPVAEKSFEIEVTVGEDGSTIDLNMAWDLRTPRLAPTGQAAKFNLTTQILTTNGGSTMQELGTTSEKVPRLVFLVLDYTILPPVVAEKIKRATAPKK